MNPIRARRLLRLRALLAPYAATWPTRGRQVRCVLVPSLDDPVCWESDDKAAVVYFRPGADVEMVDAVVEMLASRVWGGCGRMVPTR